MFVFRLLFLLAFAAPVWAADQEAETDRFLREVFTQPPAPEILWLAGELRPAARAILEHDYPAVRVRYWRIGQRTAWVLDEIGKELPITVGISVDHGAVERVRVLVYRESRGWEVKSPAFTRQFDGARLTARQTLDRGIDGISGATLSVRALTRLARLALLFHNHVVGTVART
ncbi:MAG: FMN-binding protein [Betaproteobacteria bacterium]|nr:FMN-binding protein [Betaproteobacteria bacterium]